MKSLFAWLTSAVLLAAAPAVAQTWTLDSEQSHLAFGSVKKDIIGEVHTFQNLTGSVDGYGKVSIDIDLTSVQTNIDIRNERMTEHVFKGAPKAKLTAELDMKDLKKLTPGKSKVVEVEAVLSFLGVELDVYTEMFVVRTSGKSVMVTTNDMVMVNTEDLEINPGIDKLMELAELPSITRVAPVTARFVFERK